MIVETGSTNVKRRGTLLVNSQANVFTHQTHTSSESTWLCLCQICTSHSEIKGQILGPYFACPIHSQHIDWYPLYHYSLQSLIAIARYFIAYYIYTSFILIRPWACRYSHCLHFPPGDPLSLLASGGWGRMYSLGLSEGTESDSMTGLTIKGLGIVVNWSVTCFVFTLGIRS